LNEGIIVAAKANQNPPVQIPASAMNALSQLLFHRQHTDGAKNNTGEGISKDELEDTRDEQEETAEEDDGTTSSSNKLVPSN
jgi:hypothetical protein